MRVRGMKIVAAWAVMGVCAGVALAQGQPSDAGASGAGGGGGGPGLPTKPVMLPQQKVPGESATAAKSVFMPEGVDARQAIEAAVARATQRQQRVVIVWGGNGPEGGASGRGAALKAVMTLPDMQKLLGREYQLVLANVFDGVYAKDNMAVAQAYGVKFEPEGDNDAHATIMALDAQGVPAAQMCLATTVDKFKPSRYVPNKIEMFLFDHRAPMPSAEEVLNAALARAKSETRHVFLRFHEPPDEWGDRFEAWVKRPEISAILEKHMVVCRIDITRNGLGGDLFGRYAPRPPGYPWYLIVDENGTGLAFSQTPVDTGPNIGFPTDDAEITSFIALVKVGAPALSAAEEKVIRDSLVAEREARRAEHKAGK